MIITSDTSPLNYLVLVGHADVLRKIFGQVIVPAAVVTELQHHGAPEAVRQWADNLPSWLLVRDPLQLDPSIELGRGESHAISLAIELHADLLLIDDRWGNRAAKARGITVASTLNVLQAASKRG